jgi:hypothetical protein
MSMAVACLAEPVKEPNYTSEKPRYAKLAVAKDGSKVLAVVFDESKGTGEGYDILYADTDFNGTFDPGEKLQAKVHKCSPTGIHCNFPAFTVDVPFDKKAAGIPKPCELTLNYAKHWYTTRVEKVSLAARILGSSASKTTGPLPGNTRVNENFYVYATVALPERSERWEYSFQGQTKPSESLKDAPVWSFNRPPALEITTKPDPQKKGHLGIGVNFSSGEIQMRCTKAGQPAKGHVEIKKRDGSVVHKEDVGLDKLSFG